MIETGDLSFDRADDANIPVDIWLTQTINGDGDWELSAANYMPRRQRIVPDAYYARSSDREDLNRIIRNKIIPLYKAALLQLEKMLEEPTAGNLYYWSNSPYS